MNLSFNSKLSQAIKGQQSLKNIYSSSDTKAFSQPLREKSFAFKGNLQNDIFISSKQIKQ